MVCLVNGFILYIISKMKTVSRLVCRKFQRSVVSLMESASQLIAPFHTSWLCQLALIVSEHIKNACWSKRLWISVLLNSNLGCPRDVIVSLEQPTSRIVCLLNTPQQKKWHWTCNLPKKNDATLGCHHIPGAPDFNSNVYQPVAGVGTLIPLPSSILPTPVVRLRHLSKWTWITKGAKSFTQLNLKTRCGKFKGGGSSSSSSWVPRKPFNAITLCPSNTLTPHVYPGSWREALPPAALATSLLPSNTAWSS